MSSEPSSPQHQLQPGILKREATEPGMCPRLAPSHTWTGEVVRPPEWLGSGFRGLWLGSLAGFVGNGFSIEGRWPSTPGHVLISRALARVFVQTSAESNVVTNVLSCRSLAKQVKWSCACLRVLKSMAPGPRAWPKRIRPILENRR